MPKVTMAVLVAAAALLHGVQLAEGEMASDSSSRPLFPKMRPMRPLRRMMKAFFPQLAGAMSAGEMSKHGDGPTDKQFLQQVGVYVDIVYKNLQNMVNGDPMTDSTKIPTREDWDSQLSLMERFINVMMKMHDCYKMTDADKEQLRKATDDVEALKDHQVHLKGHDFMMGAVDRLGKDFAGYINTGFKTKLKPLVEEQDYMAKVALRLDKLDKDMSLPYPAWMPAVAEHTKEIESYMSEHKHAADSPNMVFIKTAVAAIKTPSSVTPPDKPTEEKPYGVVSTPPLEPLAVSEPVKQTPTMFSTKSQQEWDQEHELARDAYKEYLKKMAGYYTELSEWAKQKTIIEEWVKFDLRMNTFAISKAGPVADMIAGTIAEIEKKSPHCARPTLPEGATAPARRGAAKPAHGGAAKPDSDGAATPEGEGAAKPAHGGAAKPDSEGAATPEGEGAAEPALPTVPQNAGGKKGR